jgi:hypothetical protein
MRFLIIILAAVLSALAAHAAGVRDEGIIATAPADAYVGSANCSECHPGQYAHWSRTLKARFVRLRKDVAALPGEWAKSPVRKDKGNVMLVVGLNRKAAFVGKDWRVLGAEYLFAKGKWRGKPGWEKHDYRQHCGACHLTGCNPYEKRYTELGVGCEACHGPGKRHAENAGDGRMAVPGRDGRDILATCRRCHNDRNNHADAIQGFAGTYHPAGLAPVTGGGPR